METDPNTIPREDLDELDRWVFDEPEWLNPPCLGCGSRGCDNPNCGDLESQE